MTRRGVEIVNSSNAVGGSSEWILLSNDYRAAPIAGQSVTVAEYLLVRGGQRRIVWMWYLTGGQLTARPWRIKLVQAEYRLIGRPQNVFLFAISARFN